MRSWVGLLESWKVGLSHQVSSNSNSSNRHQVHWSQYYSRAVDPFKTKSICWASLQGATQLSPLVLHRPWHLSTSSPQPAWGTLCSRTQSTRHWWTTLTYSAFLSACCTPRSTAWRGNTISRSLTKKQLQTSPCSRSISRTSRPARIDII